MIQVDVLCVGYACWDLNFQVEDHPAVDEKTFAKSLISEGGGPAANAAIAVAKLGGRAAFAGRLGNDVFGNAHIKELEEVGVDTGCISVSDTPTSTSSIWVNDQGKRTLVNYKPERQGRLTINDKIKSLCVLVDGHELDASVEILKHVGDIPTLLDAGSLTDETLTLASQVSHLVASSTFASDLSQSENCTDWIKRLAELAPNVAVTCGEHGVHWQTTESPGGHIQSLPVEAIDTTAAGDIFHGACALALSKGISFSNALAWANEVAAVSVTRSGGRSSCPKHSEIPTPETFSRS